jgi:uncharacterized protein HemY
MIRLFLYTLFAIVTGLLVTLFLAREPGYLLISFAGGSFETSLFALFVAIIALLILLRLLLLIFDWINPLRLVSAGRSWTQTRAQRRANTVPVTEEMLRETLRGDLVAQLEHDDDGVLTLSELRKLWKKRTKKIATDAELISVYVDVLVQSDALDEALKTLEKALATESNERLVRQYSMLSLRASDSIAAQQLRNAEAWLQRDPRDPQVLLALGRISLRNQLWGKAREYFERSLAANASSEVFAELARLLHNLKEPERSSQFLATQTRLISKTLPDFPQPI